MSLSTPLVGASNKDSHSQSRPLASELRPVAKHTSFTIRVPSSSNSSTTIGIEPVLAASAVNRLATAATAVAVDCYNLAGLSAQLDIIVTEFDPSRLVGRELPSSTGIHAL